MSFVERLSDPCGQRREHLSQFPDLDLVPDADIDPVQVFRKFGETSLDEIPSSFIYVCELEGFVHLLDEDIGAVESNFGDGGEDGGAQFE